MRRRSRLLLVAVAAVSSGLAVLLFTALSSATEGPLSTVSERMVTAFGSLEYRLRRRVIGSARHAKLAWLPPYRADLARLRQPDRILLGAYDSRLPDTLDGVVQLEQKLDTAFPLVQIYTAWGDKASQRFPLRLVTSIWDMGSIPVITWEPWLTDFESARHPHLPLRENRDWHGLAAVARGDYDFYIDTWAAEAARFGKPLFLRFAHEMNDPYRYPWGPQNNTKEEFIAAWTHVIDRFHRAGAAHVLWVWSPHLAYSYWETYFPGPELVDWVATGALNFGSVAHWSKWWTFRELFGLKYERVAAFGKPVMIAELGSLAVGGDRAAWYREALTELPRNYPAVRAVLFFNAANDQTVTYQKVDWSIADPALAREVVAAMETWKPESR
jgi:hypothetical protein